MIQPLSRSRDETVEEAEIILLFDLALSRYELRVDRGCLRCAVDLESRPQSKDCFPDLRGFLADAPQDYLKLHERCVGSVEAYSFLA